MTDLPPAFIVATALAAFLVGLSKGGIGGALGPFVTSLLALFMPLDRAIGLLLPILMLGDIFALAAHWRRWDRRLVVLLLPGALVGVTVGTFVITRVSATVLRKVLGSLVLLFVGYRLLERRLVGLLRYSARGWHGLLAGTASGFASTLAHTGGPPVTIYLLLQDVVPTVFVATAALYFALVNWIKVPYYYYANLFDFELQLQILWLMPLVPFGVWVGKLLSERVDKRTFEWIVLLLLLVSALMLLIRR